MKLFHGTTVDNALSIVKQGFAYRKNNWTCSEKKTYFFHSNYVQQEYQLATEAEILEQGIRLALEQSMITLALENPVDYRGAVLVFDSDRMQNAAELEPDDSCPNMDSMAVALKNPDLQGLIGVYVMNEDLKAFRFFTLASLQRNEYLKEAELNSLETELVNAIAKTDLLCQTCEISSQITWKELSTIRLVA